MAAIKFIQVLCPARHLIAAMAFDAEKTSEAETKRVFRQSLARNNINACKTCGTRELRFEIVQTDFETIAEAGRAAVENNDIAFVEMHKKFKVQETVHISPSNRCVRCKKDLDAATGLQTKEPKECDISICFYCGQIHIFRRDKTLRAPSGEELARMKAELKREQPEVLRLVEQAVLRFVAGKARREN